MGTVSVTSRDGLERIVPIRPDVSLMETLRDAGVDDILALCGGCCACATCHVYVDDEQFALLTPMTEDEDELLESSDHRRANSRLSCQVIMSEAHDDLRVTVAPED